METPQNASEMLQVVQALNYQRDYDPFAKWALEQLSSLLLKQERQIEALKQEISQLRLQSQQEYYHNMQSQRYVLLNQKMDNKVQQLAQNCTKLDERLFAVEYLAAQQAEALNRHEYRLYKGSQ